jgi:hypothetical protein
MRSHITEFLNGKGVGIVGFVSIKEETLLTSKEFSP